MVINDHRQFLYNGGVETGKLFEAGQEIPDGWFDRPDATEWYNHPAGYEPKPKNSVPVPPVGATESDSEAKHAGTKTINQDAPKPKYPSQMNKDELIEFGTNLGLSFDAGMNKREMREAVKSKIKGDADESENE